MEDDEIVDRFWKVVKEFFVIVCKEVFGFKKYYYKDWIFVEILSKIRVRKEKKVVVNFSRIRVERFKV